MNYKDLCDDSTPCFTPLDYYNRLRQCSKYTIHLFGVENYIKRIKTKRILFQLYFG